MTPAEKKHMHHQRKVAAYRRRIVLLRDGYDMKWTRQQTDRLAERCRYIGRFEGVDDYDLRSLVRLYNREVLGQ